MQNESDTIPAGPENPEAHARDAAEAMRARSIDRPDVENVLIGGARRHALFLESHGLLGLGVGNEGV